MSTTVINGLSVRSSGVADAPLTILFLHYWGGSARTWDKTIESLLASNPNIRTVSVDQRGWGASTKPNDDPAAYSIKGMAADVEAVLAGLTPKPKKVVLVGHSMGAKVSQLVAAKWKAQSDAATLAGLVLVSPAPPSPIIVPDDRKEQMLRTYDSADAVRALLKNLLTAGDKGAGLSDEQIQQVVEDSTSGGTLARESWPTRGLSEDIEAEVLKGLSGDGKVPILILMGEHDKVDPLPMVKEKVLAKLPDSKLVVIPSVGHLPPVEAGKEVGKYVAEFVSAL